MEQRTSVLIRSLRPSLLRDDETDCRRIHVVPHSQRREIVIRQAVHLHVRAGCRHGREHRVALSQRSVEPRCKRERVEVTDTVAHADRERDPSEQRLQLGGGLAGVEDDQDGRFVGGLDCTLERASRNGVPSAVGVTAVIEDEDTLIA